MINSFYENGESIGLGLGSQMCQIFAIFYPNELDHYLEQFGPCGRFNDDFYVMVHTKEEAQDILTGVKEIVKDLELELNEEKTHIVKATHMVTFLKTKFNLLKNGEVLKRPNRKSITHERQKLKKQQKKLDGDIMTFPDVRASYGSWKGSLKTKKCYKTIESMDMLFNRLFIEEWRKKYVEQERTSRDIQSNQQCIEEAKRDIKEAGRDYSDAKQSDKCED